MLSEAQNALLKTLEEPPSASMFVLVTSRPDVLLPTVRSRCQRLRFGRLSPGDVAAVLMRAARLRAGRRACGRLGGRRQHRAALDGGSTALVEAREAAAERAAAGGAGRAIRAAGSTARRLLGGRRRSRRAAPAAAGAGLDAARPRRDWRSRPSAERGAGLANADLASCRCGAWPARSIAIACRGRLPPSIARSRRSIATPARRSSPTGWRFSCRG